MKKKRLLLWGSIIVVLIIALTIVNALLINPHTLKIREEKIVINEKDKNLDNLLIAYFSDMHYGHNYLEDDLNNLIQKLNDFKPDIIIFGGDLIQDASKDEIDYLKQELSLLSCRYGKYAVLGDEDFINSEISDLLIESDFTILNNENISLYINETYLNIVGIEPLVNGNPNIDVAYDGIKENYYTLAVSHCPDILDQIKGTNTNLLLAGHSLGGPIYFPLINHLYRKNGCKNYFHGKYKADNLSLDITNGLGTINKNARLNADAELVLYKFTFK